MGREHAFELGNILFKKILKRRWKSTTSLYMFAF